MVTVRFKQARELLVAFLRMPHRQPVLIWGPPGIGKSDLVREAAAEVFGGGAELRRMTEENIRETAQWLIDIRAVLLDPVDLRGVPKINGDNLSHWAPPAFLPREGSGVLFLDEILQAPTMVQAALLQLTLDGKIGEYSLPPGWRIVAATNRLGDRAGVHRIIGPLANRFFHAELEASHEEWDAWASRENLAIEVRAHLRLKTSSLYAYDPQDPSPAQATPRSWHRLALAWPHIAKLDKAIHLAACAGFVGDGHGAEFLATAKLISELPDPLAVLADPEHATVPAAPSVCIMLVTALVERLKDKKKADEKKLDAFLTYVTRMPAEYGVMAMKDLCLHRREILLRPKANLFIKLHTGVLFDPEKKEGSTK